MLGAVILFATLVFALNLLDLSSLTLGFSHCPTHVFTPDHESVRVPGAVYLDPFEFMRDGRDVGSIGGVPRLIHQSWMDDQLPHKFLLWSNSFRIRHPEWHWILWTDDANAELVASRHPELNQSYWALENGIQRADFVRNLYMWDFGGVYADLDMECLRPLDTLFSEPLENVSPLYPPGETSSASLAFVGSMEVNPDDWTTPHSIPNAFMASTPRHPLWLLPLSKILRRMGADRAGHLHGEAMPTTDEIDAYVGTESITGPVALLNAVHAYRSWMGHTASALTTTDVVDPALSTSLDLAPRHHATIVFDTPIIYPFSWAIEPHMSPVYLHCRASGGLFAQFDPVRCQDFTRAFERGARTITYWSHTWHQGTGEDADVDVVGTR